MRCASACAVRAVHACRARHTPSLRRAWRAHQAMAHMCPLLCIPQGMDIYSNILYVKEEFAPLSALAHRCAAADKYRVECCCVTGNYYSLRWAAWALARRLDSRSRAAGSRRCAPATRRRSARPDAPQRHARARGAVLPPRAAP